MVNALHRLPALEFAEVRMLLNGPETFTPDGMFMLGEAAETRGLFLGCGMNSVGVASAGGAGMALAHCVEHGHPPFDLHEADPKRFPPEFNSLDALTARVPEVLGKHYEITYPGRQWATARGLRKTPLHGRWNEARAHFGQVYAWERPLYFGRTGEPIPSFDEAHWREAVQGEVRAAHEGAALFDQSTFGKIEVRGSGAREYLDRVCANRMDRALGQAVYTAMLNERGGFESDLTAIRIDDDHYRLYVGTTAIKKDMDWLDRHRRAGEDVTLYDSSDDYAVIGLMGPGSAEIAAALGAASLRTIPFFRSGEAEIAGHPVRAVRLSYVGESGWEITCRAEAAESVYDAIREFGARPAGMFAQTSMRIEKRFLAYGHELDADVTPLEVGLEFAVDLNKDFIGRDALLAVKAKGAENRIVSIVLEDRTAVPLGNEPVLFEDRIVGKSTSAAFGFRVGAPVALADITERSVRREGARVAVNIAGALFPGRIVIGAAFDPKGRRMRSGLQAVDRDAVHGQTGPGGS